MSQRRSNSIKKARKGAKRRKPLRNGDKEQGGR
jgi:hypothetical protein